MVKVLVSPIPSANDQALPSQEIHGFLTYRIRRRSREVKCILGVIGQEPRSESRHDRRRDWGEKKRRARPHRRHHPQQRV